MPRDAILALAGGIVAGLLYVSAGLGSAGSVILAYLAPFPLFVVGLALGGSAVTIAGAIGALAVFAFNTTRLAIIFIVATAGPIWLLTSLALQARPAAAGGGTAWYPAGNLLAWIAALGLGALGIAAAYFGMVTDGGLQQATHAAIRPVLQSILSGFPAAQLEAWTAVVARFFPALVLNSWAFMLIVNGILAQGVLSQFRRNLRPSPPIAALELPRWVGLALAAAVAAAFLPGQAGMVGQNAAIILFLPFFFLGLAVIHAVSHRWPGRAFILVLLYLVIILFGWPALVAAALGVIEQWVRIRRRLAPPGPDQESE
ncbi:MAG: DUF2232 domain-containing protein [Rhodospirillales bacterium]